MTKNILHIFAICLIFATYSSNVFATDTVSSPYVKKGKLSLEYRGGYDIDEQSSKNKNHPNKFVVNYGITDRIRPEIKLVVDNKHNQHPRISGVETGIRWQFLKPEEAWLAAALDANYKTTTASAKADKFELKLLLGKKHGNFSHLANISLESEVRKYVKRKGAALKVGWKTKYKINKQFSPGFEAYINTGKLRDELDYDEQKYRIGPTISGKISDNLKYDFGYLFGISKAATDGRVKLILSHITQF